MEDAWKGEHLIRAKPSQKDRKRSDSEVAMKLWHKKRQEQGAPAPGARRHDTFMRALHVSLKKP